MHALRSFGSLVLVGLLASLPSAQSCPELGAQATLPGDAALVRAGGVQHFADVAAGGGVHLAAWADHRSALEGLTTGVGARDVYAMRVGSDGQRLDPTSFRLAGGVGRKEDVRVAWNGTHFLVTWQVEADNGFSSSAELQGVRVEPSGAVVDAAPISIRRYDWSSSFTYALASDGDGWAVVIQGTQSGEADVEGWLVAADGAVALGNPSIVPTTSLLGGFALGSDGGQYLLAYGDGPSVRARRLSAATLAQTGGTLTIGTGGDPSIASDGDGFLVAWGASGLGGVVRYREVDAGGALGVTVNATPGSVVEDYIWPDVAWTGGGYTLAFVEWSLGPYALRAARIAADGTLLDFGGLAVGQGVSPQMPAVASLEDGSAEIVWHDVYQPELSPPAELDVFGTRATPTGFDAPVALSVGTPRQGSPDLAAGGEGYLHVVASERDGEVAIVAQRLDRAGVALDPEPVVLAQGPKLGAPRAGWNGTHFLVVWHDQGHLGFPSWETDDVVLARRVGPDGALLDAAPFVVLDGATPDVAAVADTFLVAARVAESAELWRIHGARVDGSGAVLDRSSFVIGGNFGRFPEVEALDDRWIVAYQRNLTHDSPVVTSHARVVLPDGSLLDAATLGSGSFPSVAASDGVALAAWRSAGSDPYDGGAVWARLVAEDGSLPGLPSVLVDAPDVQTHPSVAWDGARFVVAWEDERNAETIFDDRRDVYAMRVAEDGTPLGPVGGCPVASSPEDEQMPVVAGRDGSHLFALGLFVPDAPHASVRTVVVPGSAWTSLGGGLAGVAGVPALAGTGLLVPGGTVELALAGAAPSAAGGHAIGAAAADLPFFGGILVPSPQIVLTLTTDAAGASTTQVPLPPSLTPGLQIWVQSWVLDPGATAGLAGSNAMTQAAP